MQLPPHDADTVLAILLAQDFRLAFEDDHERRSDEEPRGCDGGDRPDLVLLPDMVASQVTLPAPPVSQ